METITLEQLQELFAGIRAETPWDVDGEMLWGYFFVSPSPEKLERASEALEQGGYQVVGIFKSEDEPRYVLHVQRVEVHTPETLFGRNQQFESLATEFELEAYDGMDVNPVGGAEEDAPEYAEGDEADFSEEDDAETIENPGLVAAIDALADDGSDENQAALTAELQAALYLVPIFGDPEGVSSQDEDQEGEAGDEAVQLLVCTDEEGAEFLPLFTDIGALSAWTSEPVSAMALDAAEAWDFILSQPECSGAVVNPGGRALPLERSVIEVLKANSGQASGDGDDADRE